MYGPEFCKTTHMNKGRRKVNLWVRWRKVGGFFSKLVVDITLEAWRGSDWGGCIWRMPRIGFGIVSG